MTSVRSFLSPASYARGRTARVVALVYLALVAVAAVVVLLDVAGAAGSAGGASFSTAPLVLLTAPTSFVLGEPVGILTMLLLPADPGPAAALTAVLVRIAAFVVAGLIQAAVVFRLVAGARLDGGDRVRTRATEHGATHR